MYMKIPIYRVTYIQGYHGGLTPPSFVDFDLVSSSVTLYLLYSMQEPLTVGRHPLFPPRAGIVKVVIVTVGLRIGSRRGGGSWKINTC